MKNKAKIFKLTFLVIVLAAIVAGYFFWMKSKVPPVEAPVKKTDVTVMTISKQKVQLFQELPARVEAYRSSDVRPQAEGVIRKINFTQGSFVEKGQQLYQIDSRMYQTAFEGAKLNWKAQKAKRERYKALLEQDAISKQEFDDINAAATLAQADFKKAETALSYTKVYAPISGYIGKTNFTEGALVTVNQIDPLTTIIQLDPLYVDMVEPSKDAVKFGHQKEIPVTLITEDNSYQEAGTLKFTEVFADESTDSVRLRAIFPNAERKLMPGMFVTAKLHLQPFEAITVPQRVTNRGADGGLSVWIVDKDNVAKQRKIKADQIAGDNWIVAEGLEEGDVVIYEGYLKIAEGAKVNPMTLEQVEAAKAAQVAQVPAATGAVAQAPALAAAPTPAPYVTPVPKVINPEIDHTIPEFILKKMKEKARHKKLSEKKSSKKNFGIKKDLNEKSALQSSSKEVIEKELKNINSTLTDSVPVTDKTKSDNVVGASAPVSSPAKISTEPTNTTPASSPISTVPLHTAPADFAPVTSSVPPMTGGGK